MPPWLLDAPNRGSPMDDAGFIFTCYGLTLGAVVVYAFVLLRRARRNGRAARSEDLPWT